MANLTPELELLDAIEGYVARAIEPLYQKLESVQAANPVHPDTLALRVNEALVKAMEAMRMPADGKPGRDALDLEIIETIEQGKSYPAGTFALHDGGTVLAVRDTDPIEWAVDLESAGWKVTQDGIAHISGASGEDHRKHCLTVTRTSGKVDRIEFRTSFANMDQGVHRPGMKYLAGSAVTRDESYWIARVDTDTTPPHTDWRLILKGKHRR